MDDKSSSKKHSGSFKKKSKKRKCYNSSLDEATISSFDTTYRILCPARKIGNVIENVSSIVNSLKEETRAKIAVLDAIHGSDEQVIIIYSSPTKILRGQNDSESFASDNKDDKMEPHCAAQDALLKVHDRIVEEDNFGEMSFDDGNGDNLAVARLLVPNFMVACLLGKKGKISRKLRIKTGATIRRISSEHLPPCAMKTDELVQISGKPEVVKNALYVVSTLLHQNPCKENPTVGSYCNIFNDIINKAEVALKQSDQKNSTGVRVKDASIDSKDRDILPTKVQNIFHRVEADSVVFADQRLGDNSYWAKSGAKNGYGAKAEEILGQVKGRDFRHQKTKKKRGSYRGGQIDQQSHSVKFNYSDEEE